MTTPPLTWRFDVELVSPDALVQYMSFRGLSVRELAKRVGLIKGSPCSPSVINNLRRGNQAAGRRTCTKENAIAIEKALDAPRGSLFVPKITNRRAECRSCAAGVA